MQTKAANQKQIENALWVTGTRRFERVELQTKADVGRECRVEKRSVIFPAALPFRPSARRTGLFC